MAENFFDRVYGTTGQGEVKDLYDDWAVTYDADLTSKGYVTPTRCARALADHLPDRDAPIFDFACGTGLSGAALAGQGFTVIDGVDLSDAMLAVARDRDVYRDLFKAKPGTPPEIRPGDYAAITAIGALSPGAAPPEYLEMLLACLGPGGLFVLSFNEHTLVDPAYTSPLEDVLARGLARERFREHGDHIVKLGSEATVYVLEKLV